MLGCRQRGVHRLQRRDLQLRELRDECLRAGLSFRSASDTEAILGLYLLDGERAFARLDGIFAFCLFDRESGERVPRPRPDGRQAALLGRPPRGPRLRVGARRPGRRSGSCRSRSIRPRSRPTSSSTPCRVRSSIVRGVAKLREGHLLRVGATGGRSIRRYAPPPAAGRGRPRALRRATSPSSTRLHPRTGRAPARRRRPGRGLPLGRASTPRSSRRTAAEVSAGAISTFSIGFDDPTFDEIALGRARRLGARQRPPRRGPRRRAALLDLVPSVAERRLRAARRRVDLPDSAPLQVRAAARDGGPLGGRGGRALRRLPDVPRRRAWRAGCRASRGRSGARSPRRRTPSSRSTYANLSFDFRVRKFLAGLDPDPVLRNERWLGTFQPEELPLLLRAHDARLQAELERLLHEPSAELPRRSGSRGAAAYRPTLLPQDQVLVKVDRASMSCALEVRVPFLAAAMVAFARALPADRKLAGLAGRRPSCGPMRRAASPRRSWSGRRRASAPRSESGFAGSSGSSSRTSSPRPPSRATGSSSRRSWRGSCGSTRRAGTTTASACSTS